MRTKTRSAKPRFCKSSHRSSSATATSPLPYPTPDYSSNTEESADRMSIDKSSQSDGPESNVGDEANVCEEEDMNWLGEKICLRCNIGGQLLLCSEIGCPTALHEGCIACKPSYDEEGNFYCPFCWYRLQMTITEELRNKAMLSKKVLEDFLERKLTEVGDDKEKQNDETAKGNGSNGIPVMGERNCCNNLNRMGQEKDNQQIDNEQDEEIFEDEEQTESLNAHCVEEETIVDGNAALHGSAGAKSETIKAPEGSQVREEEKQEVHKDAPEANVSNTGGNAALDEPEMSVSDTETLAVRTHSVRQRKNQNADSPETPPLYQRTNSAEEVRIQNDEVSPLKRSPKKSPIHPHTTSAEEAGNQNDEVSPLKRSSKKSPIHPPTTAVEETGNQNKEVNHLKKSRQPQVHDKKLTKMSFAREKRKRMHWTTEEEEMLREGVQKFSTAVNKNIPWRKILEFGRHVFDGSRSPADLKDKWRNIAAKESSSAINSRSS